MRRVHIHLGLILTAGVILYSILAVRAVRRSPVAVRLSFPATDQVETVPIEWEAEFFASSKVRLDSPANRYPWFINTYGAGSEVTIEPDESAEGGWRLTVSTSTTVPGGGAYGQQGADKPPPSPWNDVDNARGWSIEFSIKVASEGAARPQVLSISDDAFGENLLLHKDRIVLASTREIIPVDLGSRYTTLTVTARRNILRIFADGKRVYQGIFATPKTGRGRNMTFGDDSPEPNQGGKTYWRSLRYTTRGPAEPRPRR